VAIGTLPPPLHEPNPAVADTKTKAANHFPQARNTACVTLLAGDSVFDESINMFENNLK
jgi:hypothetical protein